MTPAPVSLHFPPHVRDALVRAAQTPNTLVDPLARQRALESAIAAAKAQHPELFKKDES